MRVLHVVHDVPHLVEGSNHVLEGEVGAAHLDPENNNKKYVF